MGLLDEIFEQPAVLSRLLSEQMGGVRRVAEVIRQRKIDYVFIAARGTSDHAALYAKYLWGAFNGLPVALATPSLFTIYQRPPRLRNALVMGISQSGQSPDINGVIVEGRRQGALTLAVTNNVSSPLAVNAEYVLDINAGQEKAVAATKTYTAQLMTLAMLSAALNDDCEERIAALRRVPEAARLVLETNADAMHRVERYRYMLRCVVLGRGFNYATAFEWALKLKELTYIIAEPYSTADFRHGPIAMIEPGFPVLAIAPRGAVLVDVRELLGRLIDEKKAELVVISDDDDTLSLTHTSFHLPGGLPEWLTPLVSIIPGQLFCYHLAMAKGHDPDSPRGLTKVTSTV